jgi:3-hydroxyacyl-[acyl-carrier-protein] dehydratase
VRIDFDQIRALIPHREPFIFVKSAEIVGIGEIHGICLWEPENPVFKGHFPELKIVPGVLLIEAAAQLAAVLLAHQSRESNEAAHQTHSQNMLGVLTGVRRASFHKPVLPSDSIHFQVTINHSMAGMVSISAEAQNTHGQKVCKCELSVALAEKSSLIPEAERRVIEPST